MASPDLVNLPTDYPPPRPMGLPPAMDGSVGNGSLPPLLVPDVLNLGREKLPEWTPAIWSRIDEAAMGEIDRASVAVQFLPRVPSINPSARTVPASRIERIPDDDDGQLNVDQTQVRALLEKSQLFFLSKEQYYEEKAIATAAILAARSANRLARKMDAAIFSDLVDIAGEQHTVTIEPLNVAVPAAAQIETLNAQIAELQADAARNQARIDELTAERDQLLPIAALDAQIAALQAAPGRRRRQIDALIAERDQLLADAGVDKAVPGVYGEKLFTGVAAAYSYLQGKNLYGPFALVLPPEQFADAHAPLKTTLIMPADRIRPLMTAGFYTSGTLPANRGVMISLGGTVDLAIAVHGATAFTLVEADETRRFRIYERFTVRIKVPESLVLLEFK